jgi:hypothetical protein
MKLHIGVDFHPHQQTVAYCDTADGEIMLRTFRHSEREKLDEFYGSFDKPAQIGQAGRGDDPGFAGARGVSGGLAK